MRNLPSFLSSSLVIAAFAAAQQHEAIRGSFGVSSCRGELLAGGPAYSASFRGDGPVYTPLRGRLAPAAPTASSALQFTFVEARVGAHVIAAAAQVAPAVAGNVVHYDRGALLERYEARADGIEQSFVLAERPAAAGDLVVRGRVTTAMPMTANGPDEVCFQLPDGGGVRFGAVTGVDAAGATMRGGMQCRDGLLELTLPAAFVAAATYPLVLDPLVGTVLTVGDTANVDDVRPAAAFDATTGRFLVVWVVDVPASGPSPAHSVVRGQFVVPGGGLVGTQLTLDNNATFGTRVAIADVNATNRFLVAWLGSAGLFANGVVGCSVAAGNGALSNLASLDTNLLGGYGDRFALGGDSRAGGGSYAVLAVRTYSPTTGLPSSNTINVRRILVPASGDPVADPAVTVATSTNLLDDIAVTAHAGTAGRWLVVFGQSVTSMAGPMQRILGQLVAANGSLCGTPITVRNAGTTGDLDHPTVATRDGTEFVVGWHDGGSNDVQLRRYEITGFCGSQTTTAGAIVSPLLSAGQAHSPALAFVKDKYLLAWQQYQSGWRVFVKGLDPATCGNCGNEQRVDLPVVVDGMPAVASTWEGGDTTSEYAFVAWCEGGAVKARHWTVHGTPGITSLGGGCGVTAFNDVATYSGSPQLGDSQFQVSLANPTSLVVALVVGFSQANLACGPCTLVPSLDLMLPALNPTPIPIPCDAGLIGFELYTQWVQLRQAGCPLLPDIGLSNCLKFTIAE